ncbi:vitamin K epoxide reductase family-domain-containing protein [Ochromonadaceae sp. CCMP2298]|nr:vitamin K epoxide reductase family-domain-containing protein [Ochromonadaceae sp. CCMP2298]|mmetsp:Transcript_16830/g.37358  ORF Transcript_16830/g.37358 Transcript_16830/m.37358 type:complete len:314 (+) Transcript_16830:91-1032(+)
MSMKNRLLISGLASTGALETGFLTYSKYFAPDATASFCTEGSCNTVLSGPYSMIPSLNVPLVAVACVGYAAVAALALAPKFALGGEKADAIAPTDSYLLFLITTMATFSGYLLTLLVTVIHASCNFCYASAAISASMAAVAYNARLVPDKTRAAIASSSMIVTVISSSLLFYATTAISPESAQASTAVAGQVLSQMAAEKAAEKKESPRITTSSSAQALQLSTRMAKFDAKMYGAYWCSHCYNQKQELGQQAFKNLEYLECDKEGANSQFSVCKAKNIPGYPTWVIGGENYPGEKSLGELEQLMTKIENKAAR